MADVSSNLRSWSTTASSNQPTDATQIGANLADNLQTIQAVVRQDLAHKGSDIASSANPDVGAVVGLYHDVTGSNTITGLGSTATAGIWKILQFDGSPVLKNSTALAMVTAADVTAQPGAVGVFFCEATNQWRNVAFTRATAGALVPAASTTQAGVLPVSTNAQALAGTADTVAVTPSALDSVLGLVKLSSGTATSTSVADVTMTAFTGYANKMLILRSFVPVSDATGCYLRFSTDGGATYDSGSNYRHASRGLGSSGGSGDVNSTAAAQVEISGSAGVGNVSSEGISAQIVMYDSTNAATFTRVTWQAAAVNTEQVITVQGAGVQTTAQDVDAIRILFGTGNISSGSWDLYGFN